eukprot:gene27091-33325_t
MAGYAGVALTGDLPAAIEGFKASAPVLVPVAKFAVAFPVVYHTLGGFRHLVWDYTVAGFSNETMEMSSYALFAASLAGSGAAAVMTI